MVCTIQCVRASSTRLMDCFCMTGLWREALILLHPLPLMLTHLKTLEDSNLAPSSLKVYAEAISSTETDWSEDKNLPRALQHHSGVHPCCCTLWGSPVPSRSRKSLSRCLSHIVPSSPVKVCQECLHVYIVYIYIHRANQPSRILSSFANGLITCLIKINPCSQIQHLLDSQNQKRGKRNTLVFGMTRSHMGVNAWIFTYFCLQRIM